MAKKKNKTPKIAMKTIPLDIVFDEEWMIAELIRWCNDFTNIIRFLFKRLKKKPDLTISQMEEIVQNKFVKLDGWFIRSACIKAKAIYESDEERKIFLKEQQDLCGDLTKFIYLELIFGSRKLFEKRSKGEISKEEFWEARLMSLYSVGEANQYGNRKMNFDLTNCRFDCKLNNNVHLSGSFVPQNKSRKEELALIQKLANEKRIPITFDISSNRLNLQYDSARVYNENIKSTLQNHGIDLSSIKQANRYGAVDLNPNGIGFVIKENEKIIFKKIYSMYELTEESGLHSSDPKSVYLNNKRKYEVNEICTDIVEILCNYNASLFGVEDLKFNSGDNGKGKTYNRLVNNVWNYREVTDQLKKKCLSNGIKFKYVNCDYSSFIGNIMYRLPDPISAACEIARRLYHSDKFYPDLIDLTELANRWNGRISSHLILQVTSWKELYELVKKSGFRYRYEIPSTGFRKAFSFKSKVFCLQNEQIIQFE